ncbi:hypothetical protein ABIF21_004634 [Bradyrhizobium elkanii]
MTITPVRGLDAAVERLAAIGLVIAAVVGERGTDALQDSARIERPRDRVGGAERPGLHRGVMQGIRQHEQPRHLAIGVGLQLGADELHGFGRAQVDVDDDAGEIAGRLLGNVGSRNGIDLAHRAQNAGELVALVASI